MQTQDAITTNTNQNERLCRSEYQYRRDVLAEIIDYGHAACKNESAFQNQVGVWNLELLLIPTDRLLGCFIDASRGRVLTFDVEPLTTDEMLKAWRNKNPEGVKS